MSRWSLSLKKFRFLKFFFRAHFRLKRKLTSGESLVVGSGCSSFQMLTPWPRRVGQKEFVGALLLAVIGLVILLQQLRGGFWEQSDSPLEISDETKIFEVDSGGYISIRPRYPLMQNTKIKMLFSETGLVTTMDSFVIPSYSKSEIFIPLHTEDSVAHVTLTFKTLSAELPQLFKAHVHIKIVHYVWLAYLSLAIGWSYFLAWSISYYPQFYKNFKRRSVVGLSFDYLLLNIIGHSSYCAFNASLYYNSQIQMAYFAVNPNSEIPVKTNDVFFSVHAVFMTSLVIVQCIVYDRGDQQLSPLFICLATGMLFTVFGGLMFVWGGQINWLRYIYLLSFVKVAVTPLKYIPQVSLNHKRQSMEGFAITGVMMDFTGGILSLLQAVLDSVNSDDWSIIFGNPGKLALAIIGICFNIVFFFQYAIFSRSTSSKNLSRSRKDSGSVSSSAAGSSGIGSQNQYRPVPLVRVRDV